MDFRYDTPYSPLKIPIDIIQYYIGIFCSFFSYQRIFQQVFWVFIGGNIANLTFIILHHFMNNVVYDGARPIIQHL